MIRERRASVTINADSFMFLVCRLICPLFNAFIGSKDMPRRKPLKNLGLERKEDYNFSIVRSGRTCTFNSEKLNR
ncbi:MAG: hypothetical protein HW412_1563 [Bacteroidetes bacterium]|nr:hypothetical protein [Bacteroidota bacterium]